MTQAIIYDLPTPGIIVRYPVEPVSDDEFAAQAADYPGSVHLVDADTLPLACRNAWIWKDGAVAVDLDIARSQRATELAVEAKTMAAELLRVIAAAVEDDNVALAASMRALRKQIMAVPDLSTITDPGALETFEPPAFEDARAALA